MLNRRSFLAAASAALASLKLNPSRLLAKPQAKPQVPESVVREINNAAVTGYCPWDEVRWIEAPIRESIRPGTVVGIDADGYLVPMGLDLSGPQRPFGIILDCSGSLGRVAISGFRTLAFTQRV